MAPATKNVGAMLRKGSDIFMAVTTKDIQLILDGSQIEIELANPFDEGVKWYMRQLEDWESDLAVAVRESEVAKAGKVQAIQDTVGITPSNSWFARYNNTVAYAKQRIVELEAQGESITPLDRVELAKQRDLLDGLIDPNDFNRADETIGKYARKRFEAWVIGMAVVSEKGERYFDPETKQGRRRWQKIGDQYKDALRMLYYYVQDLESTAKN